MSAQTVLPVDPKNPGQVLACGGLLELLLRCHGPVFSFFHLADPPSFTLHASETQIIDAVNQLVQCPVEAHDDDSLTLGPPFDLRLDWWLERAAGALVPKTWAGGVRPKSFFPAYQKALRPAEHPPATWWDVLVDQVGSASPGLDPREFTHTLDTGFSAYDAGLKTATFIYVQMLAFLGLQRFRPAGEARGFFSYTLWQAPLLPSVAALTFSGQSPVGAGPRFWFRLRARDQENRYKAFSFAERKGGNR